MIAGPGPCVVEVPLPPGLTNPDDSIQVITAPSGEEARHDRTVFLAGGITDCPDWQADLISVLILRGVRGLTLFNPRRPNFDVRDPSASDEQIAWEYDRLREADVVSFWFPRETLCPTTLYELGALSTTDKPLIVGTDPNYARRYDVVKQTSLRRPDVIVSNSLLRVADKIADLPKAAVKFGFTACGVWLSHGDLNEDGTRPICRKPVGHDGTHAFS